MGVSISKMVLRIDCKLLVKYLVVKNVARGFRVELGTESRLDHFFYLSISLSIREKT